MFSAPFLHPLHMLGTSEVIRILRQPFGLASRMAGRAAVGLLTKTLPVAIAPIREEDLVAVLADALDDNLAHPTNFNTPKQEKAKRKNTPPEEGRRQFRWNGG
jgi:hypothetical protein